MRADLSQRAFLDTLRVLDADGGVLTHEIAGVPRGVRLRVAGTRAQVALTWGGLVLPVPVAEDGTGHLAGADTLFAIAVEPDPAVVADWLRYHAQEQGATAALVLSRDGDDAPAVPPEVPDGIETLLWVRCPGPLGRLDAPAEHVRHLAPDAPGKAMLEPAPHDPLRSPLAEIAVLEALRARFFAKARAVLYCHPSDLVPRADQGRIFDRTVERGGFLRFGGTRAYPVTRNDPPPRHADHGAVAFDGSRAEHLWCAAPGHLPSDAFWRQFRVTGLANDVDPAQTYWRCMGIRHPQLKVSELVPKSSLVPAPDLAAEIERTFGVRPPMPETAARAPKTRRNDRILVITTMKNEGPFILDWLAYHRAIGVTDVLVYTNDCTDGTDGFFDLLAEKGLVTHRQNPYRETGERPQHAALFDASETEVAAEADWIICMDVDEYINVHVGDGTLNSLFAAIPEATMISLTWRLFGNGDVAAFEDRPIHTQFTLAAPEVCRKPHQAWGFKTLFRNLGHYKKFGVHRPKGLRPEYLEAINWVNGSGAAMPRDIYRTGWRSNMATYGYGLVSLNHYALRSAESFLVKRDRGRVNHVARDQGLAYWFRMNHNAVEETSILRPDGAGGAFQAEKARLLEDPDIAAAHHAAVAAHRTRIAELLADAEFRALYGEITGERLRALSRMLHHFGTAVFLEGPGAVPEDFHLRQSVG